MGYAEFKEALNKLNKLYGFGNYEVKNAASNGQSYFALIFYNQKDFKKVNELTIFFNPDDVLNNPSEKVGKILEYRIARAKVILVLSDYLNINSTDQLPKIFGTDYEKFYYFLKDNLKIEFTVSDIVNESYRGIYDMINFMSKNFSWLK